MFEELFLHTAQVVKIDDEDKKGKVQIKILPEMEKLKDDVLPWAMPFVTHLSENTLENDLPEENSVIRVLRDKTWKRFYYLQNRYFYGLYDFDKVKDIFDNTDGLDNVDTEYKNIHFRLYADQTLVFHNDSDGSHGIIQSTGSYAVFNADGSLLSHVQKDIIVTHEENTDYKQKGSISFEVEKDVNITGKDTLTASFDKSVDLTANDTLSLLVKKLMSITGHDQLNAVFSKDITLKVDGGSLLLFGNQVSTLGQILVELMTYLSELITIGPPTLHTSPKLRGEMLGLIAKTKKVFK